MNLKFLSIILICSFISNTYGQILKKEKIYTLDKNEYVAHEENSLGLYQDELGYIVVTADVKDFSRSYHIKGKKYGPFNRRELAKPVFNYDNWGFIDSKDETSYVIYTGKELGVHELPFYPVGLKIRGNSWAYVLINQAEGTTEVVINGKKRGPYLSLQNYHLSKNGKRWAIIYNNRPEEHYVVFDDGKTAGPYAEIIDFQFLEPNRWVLTAEPKDSPTKILEGGQKVKQIIVETSNGVVGTYERELLNNPNYDCDNLIARGSNYGLNIIKDQKIYYLANDELYGPHEGLVQQVDMGKSYNRFNFVVGKEKRFYIKGEKGFSRNVEMFAVSDSRKNVAIIKRGSGIKDSLVMNDKYFKGLFDKIAYVKFAPQSESWCLLSKSNNGYYLHFSNKKKQGPFNIDDSRGVPQVMLGKNCENWAMTYKDSKSNEIKLIVNGQEKKDKFIGNIAITSEADKEYFSWFSLEDKTVFLNKLLLK